MEMVDAEPERFPGFDAVILNTLSCRPSSASTDSNDVDKAGMGKAQDTGAKDQIQGLGGHGPASMVAAGNISWQYAAGACEGYGYSSWGRVLNQ
jgi:hypothetical protein